MFYWSIQRFIKNIKVDYMLLLDKLLSSNRLNNIIANILTYDIFDSIDYIMVQGDTSTSQLCMYIIFFKIFKLYIHIIHLFN